VTSEEEKDIRLMLKSATENMTLHRDDGGEVYAGVCAACGKLMVSGSTVSPMDLRANAISNTRLLLEKLDQSMSLDEIKSALDERLRCEEERLLGR